MTPRDKHDNCARKKHYHHPGTRCKDAIPRVIIYFQVLIISIKDVSSTILHDHRLMAKGTILHSERGLLPDRKVIIILGKCISDFSQSGETASYTNHP